MVKILALVAIIAVTGCQTPKGGFCAIANQYRPSKATIAVMTDQEVKDALSNLEKGRRLCGWQQ